MSNTPRETIHFLTSSNPPDTPWGPALAKAVVADGIDLFITSNHGGYHLSPERVAKMPHPLGNLGTWSGGTWYERDNDGALVVFSFPELFTDCEVFFAVARMLQQCPIYLKGVDVWLETPAAKPLRDRCDAFYAENKTKFNISQLTRNGDTFRMNAITLDSKLAVIFETTNPLALPAVFTMDELLDSKATILRTATAETITNETPAP